MPRLGNVWHATDALGRGGRGRGDQPASLARELRPGMAYPCGEGVPIIIDNIPVHHRLMLLGTR